MNRRSAFLALYLVGSAGSAFAADLDAPLRPSFGTDPVGGGPRWQGVNVGLNAGGLWTPGNRATQNWFPPDTIGGAVPGGAFSLSSGGWMGGAQIGYNQQWGSFVFGGEGDFDYANATTKKNASGTFLGIPFTAVQTQKLQSLGTIRARFGYSLLDDLLVYGTAGLAFGETQLSSSLNDGAGVYAGTRNSVQVGWTAGAGVEYSLGPQWSVGAQFLYYDLGKGHVVSVANFGAPPGTASEIGTSADMKGYTLRLGLNYDLDGVDGTPDNPVAAREISMRLGTRAGMSTSKARLTLYDGTGNTLLSRLTYQNPTAATGEVFGQIDDSSGVFFKGFAGIGKHIGGTLKDEDFPPGIEPYSSTNSPQKDGHLMYASADAGYYGLSSSWYKFGGFAGYHFVDEQFNAFGCTQTAGNPDVCTPGQVAANNLTISDDGRWQSVRLGLAGQATLPNGITVRGEAAWLPFMFYSGGNDHWLREPSDFAGTIPETAVGYLTGVQLEGEATYALSKNFDIGAGARFWSMSARGHVLFQDATPLGGSQVATFATQRLQAFVQSAYRF